MESVLSGSLDEKWSENTIRSLVEGVHIAPPLRDAHPPEYIPPILNISRTLMLLRDLCQILAERKARQLRAFLAFGDS
jgi:hypothetical protein